MKRIIVCIAAVLCLFSCKSAIEYPGLYYSTYIDYEVIRAAGCEVYETNVPEGHKAIGQLKEIIFAKEISCIDSDCVYSVEAKLLEHISEAVKLKGGVGIANFRVSSNLSRYPTYVLTGTVYK